MRVNSRSTYLMVVQSVANSTTAHYYYTLEATRMEFNQKECEHLLNCLNFYYSESDHKEFIMEVNSTLCKKIDEQLTLHRRAF